MLKARKEFSLPGITNSVENVIAVRDAMLAGETGARLHLCHCSTKESVRIIREAKKQGIDISGEVCPHHFVLCENDIDSAANGNYKMNPPLRTKVDREALRGGLSDGTLEVIATDHAPHTEEEKSRGFAGSPFGIVGLETAASLAYTCLVMGGYLSPMQMVEKMSYNPARILGLDVGDLSEGKRADITIFNPYESYEIRAGEFAGRAKNMPYEGMKVTGRVVGTIMGGKITYKI